MKPKSLQILISSAFTFIFIFITNVSGNPSIEMVSQNGHRAEIREITLSTDGLLMASVGDHCILWRNEDALILRTIHHPTYVNCVSISPDKKRVATGDGEGIVRVWEIATGALVYELKSNASTRLVDTVSFSPDGQKLAAGSHLHPLSVWDMQNGKQVASIKIQDMSGVRYLKFSKDGKILVTAGAEGDIFVWNAKTLTKIRNFSSGQKSIYKIDINRNGSLVAVAGSGDVIKLFNTDNGSLVHEFSKAESSFAVAFSPDQKTIAAGDRFGYAHVWDIASGKEIWNNKLFVNGIYSLIFSPDGETLISSAAGGLIEYCSSRTGDNYRFLQGKSGPKAVVVSPNGKYFAVPSTMILMLWDRASLGAKKLKIDGHRFIFSPDSNYIYSDGGSIISMHDLDNNLIRTFKNRAFLYTIALSPDGKTITGADHEKGMSIWSTSDGKLLYTCDTKSRIEVVAYSADSKIIATGMSDKKVLLWNAATGKQIGELEGKDAICSLAISHDGKKLFCGTRNGSLQVWDMKSGNLVFNKLIHDGSIWSSKGAIVGLSISPDGKTIATGSFDTTVKLWDTEKMSLLKTLKHTAGVSAVEYTPDGKQLLYNCNDGTIRLWNIQKGDSLTMMSDGTDWIAYTNDGYFDASSNGGRLVAMTRGTEGWGVDQFAFRLNRPDIILERFNPSSTAEITFFKNRYVSRLKKNRFTESDISSDLHVPSAAIADKSIKGSSLVLSGTLSDSKYDLKSYNIYVNDVPIFGAQGKNISGNNVRTSDTFDLGSGMNKIELTCINEKGAESFRALTFSKNSQKKKGNLLYIGFGVSTYQNQELNLKYADKDASDLEKCFQSMKTSFNEIKTLTFINRDVTQNAIQRARDFALKGNTDDTLVLFIAGHGMHSQNGTYYYLTHEADPDNIEKSCVPFEEIESILQGIKPRNKLFLMDTCESGEENTTASEKALTNAAGRGIKARAIRSFGVKRKTTGTIPFVYMNNRYIFNDLSRRSGAIVFSSSRGGEYSYESDTIQNGYFTRELINALTSKKVDANSDGIISVDELKAAVPKNVSEKTMGLQNPVIDRDNIFQKFGFPLTK